MENNTVREETVNKLEDIFKTIGEIEARILKEPRQYTSMRDIEYCECPMGYNDDMSRAMASDMFYYHMMLSGKYPDLATLLDGWMLRMSKLNYRLLRMIDDNDGDRPMKPWKFKRALKFAEQIHNVMKAATEINTKEPDDMLKDFLNRCKVWTARIIYMNTWAYCLENIKNIEQTLNDVRTEMFDNDGNKIFRLDEDKKALVTDICQIRKRLTDLIIEIPVNTEDYKYIIDTLDIFNKMCQSIMKAE